MALDHVCKMNVQETGSPSAEYHGTTYYFCCDVCRDTFVKSPEEHVTGHSHSHHGHSQKYD